MRTPTTVSPSSFILLSGAHVNNQIRLPLYVQAISGLWYAFQLGFYTWSWNITSHLLLLVEYRPEYKMCHVLLKYHLSSSPFISQILPSINSCSSHTLYPWFWSFLSLSTRHLFSKKNTDSVITRHSIQPSFHTAGTMTSLQAIHFCLLIQMPCWLHYQILHSLVYQWHSVLI